MTIICQDRGAKFMEEIDDYVQGELTESLGRVQDGKLRVVVPDVGGVIPILADHKSCNFEGVSCKTLPNMTDEEI